MTVYRTDFQIDASRLRARDLGHRAGLDEGRRGPVRRRRGARRTPEGGRTARSGVRRATLHALRVGASAISDVCADYGGRSGPGAMQRVTARTRGGSGLRKLCDRA
jgi:hypothetical protein